MFSTSGDVQCIGGCERRGDIMRTSGGGGGEGGWDTMSTSGGYHNCFIPFRENKMERSKFGT